MSKICLVCNKTKPNLKFGLRSSAKDKLQSRCLLCERIRDKNREHTFGRRFSMYKKRAKQDGLNFKINADTFENITGKPCEYCGGYSVSNNYKFCGIDRLNSTKGYIETNIVPCCNICNMMKGTLTYDEFTRQIVTIFGNLSTKE